MAAGPGKRQEYVDYQSVYLVLHTTSFIRLFNETIDQVDNQAEKANHPPIKFGHVLSWHNLIIKMLFYM